MHDLFSDNTSPMAPELLKAIIDANEGHQPSYAADGVTRAAEELFSQLFGRQVALFFLSTGTAANALSLATLCPPWKRVLCQRHSHIMETEAGAPEAAGGGLKLSAPAEGGEKITARMVETECARRRPNDPHAALYGALSVSQATEIGTVYRLDELEALGAAARENGLAFHVDGARFANAVVTLGCAPGEFTGRAGIDAMSFGLAKNGGALGDAIVLFDLEKAEELRFRQMRAGHLIAKNRFLAAQAIAAVRDGLWLKLASQANGAARLLADVLSERGVHPVAPVEANLVFATMRNTQVKALKDQGYPISAISPSRFQIARDDCTDTTIVRFVTSWSTTEREVRWLAALLESGASTR